MGAAEGIVAAWVALRLRDRLAPSLWPLGAASAPGVTTTMGECGRPVEGDANDEACRSITNSSVAFVSLTIFARTMEVGTRAPSYVLMMFDK